MQLATAGRANPKERFGPCSQYSTGSPAVRSTHAVRLSTMARKRMLSPEMFTSRTVTAWPVPTRWTWAGLLCYLDNYGYGEDDAALVKSSVWPRDEYSAKKVAVDLDRIAADGALCRFVCCGREFMHAPRFDRHQKLSHKGDRRHCPCPKHERGIREGHARDSGSSTERFSLIEENIEEEGGTAQNGAGRSAFLEMRNKIGHSA